MEVLSSTSSKNAAPKAKPVMLLTNCSSDRPTPTAKLTQQAVRVVRFQNSPYKNGARNASKLSVSDLRKSLDILAKADEKLKSASIDGKLILEETLTKLFLAANGESVC